MTIADKNGYKPSVNIRTFLHSGGDRLMERIRPSIAVILVSCAFSGIVTAASKAMVFPGEDWQQTRPEAQGVDSVKLKAAVSYLENNSGSDGVKELVIIRNGYMIWNGPDIDKMHGVWSLTKSFTSTVLGLLISGGDAPELWQSAELTPWHTLSDCVVANGASAIACVKEGRILLLRR